MYQHRIHPLSNNLHIILIVVVLPYMYGSPERAFFFGIFIIGGVLHTPILVYTLSPIHAVLLSRLILDIKMLVRFVSLLLYSHIHVRKVSGLSL